MSFLLFHHDPILLYHLAKELTVDLFGAQNEGLLPVEHRMEKLYAVILRHDVVLDELELRVAAQRLETEFEVEQVLDSSTYFITFDAQRMELEQRQNSLDDLRQFFVAVDHLA